MEQEQLTKSKIWVGGLPPRTQKETLKDEFIREFNLSGKEVVKEISIMIKLGYGFITIPTTLMNEIEEKLKTSNIQISNKKLELIPAMKRKDARKKIENERTRKLYIGGLPIDTTKEALQEYFEQFGVLEYANLVYSVGSTQPRGFAFVKFKEDKAVEATLDFKYHKFIGQPIFIKRSIPKQEIDLKKEEIAKKKTDTDPDLIDAKNSFNSQQNTRNAAYNIESHQSLNDYSGLNTTNQNLPSVFNQNIGYNNEYQNQQFPYMQNQFDNTQVLQYNQNEILHNQTTNPRSLENNSHYKNIGSMSSKGSYYNTLNKSPQNLQGNQVSQCEGLRISNQNSNEVSFKSDNRNFVTPVEKRVLLDTEEVPYQNYVNDTTNNNINDKSRFNDYTNQNTDQTYVANNENNYQNDNYYNQYYDYSYNNDYSQDYYQNGYPDNNANPYYNNQEQYSNHDSSLYQENPDYQQYNNSNNQKYYADRSISFKNNNDYMQAHSNSGAYNNNSGPYNNSSYDGSYSEDHYNRSNSYNNPFANNNSNNRENLNACHYTNNFGKTSVQNVNNQNVNYNANNNNSNINQLAQHTPYHNQGSYNNQLINNDNFQKPSTSFHKNLNNSGYKNCRILSDNQSLGEGTYFNLIKIDNNNDFKQFQYNKNLENLPISSVTPDLESQASRSKMMEAYKEKNRPKSDKNLPIIDEDPTNTIEEIMVNKKNYFEDKIEPSFSPEERYSSPIKGSPQIQIQESEEKKSLPEARN